MHVLAASLVSLAVVSLATLPAQDGALGGPAPALKIGRCVTGKAPAAFDAGKVYLVEFWGAAPDFGLERKRDFERLTKQHESKLEVLAVMHGTDTFGFDEVKEHYEEFGKGITFCIGWDDDAKLHGAWPIAADDEPPVAFLVDQKGRLVWSGGFGFVPLVLPAVLAGDADPEALAKATKELMQKVTRVYLAAGFKPEKAVEELDKLLAEHPFLAESILPDVFGTMLEEGHRDVAMTLAKRVCDMAIATEDVQLLNGLAWTIVDPGVEAKERDLALAERAAAKAVELTKEKDADVLDTMARVCFWKQDFAAAVAWQKKAVALVDDDDVKEALQTTLAEYEARAGKK